MSGSNGNHDRTIDRLWSTPQEIGTDAVPPRRGPQGEFRDLADDILLRLEKTPRGRVLAYPLASVEAVRRARKAVYSCVTNLYGKQYISLSISSDPPVLYVERGAKYFTIK